VIPVIEILASELLVPVSIDTYKSEVARRAVASGARMINDVWELKRDPKLAQVAAEAGVPLVISQNQRDSHFHNFFPELIARFTRIIPFEPLSHDTLKEILQDNVINRYTKEFEDEGLELRVSNNVIDHLISQAEGKHAVRREGDDPVEQHRDRGVDGSKQGHERVAELGWDPVFEVLQLGEMLGAGVGGTRPAVLNGWLPMDRMIGYSGTSVKAKLCITFGSSGSTPFLHGIERSELLVAINADAEAPIFDHCDIGIIGDCIAAIEELKKCAKK
jgi:hypothetical protein